MKNNTQENFNLNHFYSTESISAWKQIIGQDLHYHFGYFQGSEDLETGLKQTIRNFYPYIHPGSRVLDIGCGWGGRAKMLITEQNCSVNGISFSTTQAEYCRNLGLNVWQQDLEKEEIKGQYDLVFSIEILSHIRNKLGLLKQMRSLAPRLILAVNCIADHYSGEKTTFGESMVLCTVSEFIEYMKIAGWTINFMQNRRFFTLRTIALWQQNFDRVYGDSQPPGQLGILRRMVETALRNPIQWCQSFPLIDIVAD